MGPRSRLPSGHQSYMLQWCLSFVLWASRQASLAPACLLPGPSLCHGCQQAGGPGWVFARLARQPGSPREGVSPLVSGAMSWGIWLRSPEGPGLVLPASASGQVLRSLVARPGSCGPHSGSLVCQLALRANRLEGEFQNGPCQHQSLCGRMSSPKWLLPVSMFPRGVPFACYPSERLSKISKLADSLFF